MGNIAMDGAPSPARAQTTSHKRRSIVLSGPVSHPQIAAHHQRTRNTHADDRRRCRHRPVVIAAGAPTEAWRWAPVGRLAGICE